ncbi:type II secretion system protein [Bowmanella denitrificans]|uniref:Type II secretion system protein n=1 Tax=Bowmanella denitrificans TaxID=366582 RepID=A0ABP3HPR1_9ALTE
MKQRGFTLIELIIVIVILGILAVTAAPKFIDIQSDASRATLQGLQSSIKGAISTTHAKSLVEGEQNQSTSSIAVPGGTVAMAYGYPTAAAAGIVAAMDIQAGAAGSVANAEWGYFVGTGTVTFAPYNKITWSATPAATDITNTNCYLTYTAATGAGTPLVVTPANSVISNSTGC